MQPRASRRPRVALVLSQYPQISETYMQNEIDALRADHDLCILTIRDADAPARRHDPFHRVDRDDLDGMAAIAGDFGADVVHAHWLMMVPLAARLAERLDRPFTVRSHSFDALWRDRRSPWQRLFGKPAEPAHIREAVAHLNGERCLGAVVLPFTRAHLRRAGVGETRLHDAPPCFAFSRFHDESPNGDGVMNGGAALPKKEMSSFIELAARVPGERFHLYPVGYEADALEAANRAGGDRVEIRRNVEPDDMPAVYKRHRWLVYTASKEIGTSGWPMMVAEAQAAGVGVVMRNLRADIADWVGPGGYVFDSLDDAARIVSQPFPEEKRRLSFAHARQHDVSNHLGVLTDLWTPAWRR